MEFGWKIVVGTIVGFLGAALGSVGGVGGGGIFVPMLTLIIGFDPKSSTAISKCEFLLCSNIILFYSCNLTLMHQSCMLVCMSLSCFQEICLYSCNRYIHSDMNVLVYKCVHMLINSMSAASMTIT